MGKQAERHLLQAGSMSRGPTSPGWGSQMVRERGLAAKATYFPRSHGHQPVREMQIKPPQLVPVGQAARAPSSSSGCAGGSWKLLAAAGAGVSGVGRSLACRQHFSYSSLILILLYFSILLC